MLKGRNRGSSLGGIWGGWPRGFRVEVPEKKKKRGSPNGGFFDGTSREKPQPRERQKKKKKKLGKVAKAEEKGRLERFS